jgi:hypothetical protein
MKAEAFEKLWLDQVQLEKSILLERADAYATGGDRLGNFKAGAQFLEVTPLRYGFGLVVKHIMALRDLIAKVDSGTASLDCREADKFAEYVTDIRNYAVLLKALYQEAQDGQETVLPTKVKTKGR